MAARVVGLVFLIACSSSKTQSGGIADGLRYEYVADVAAALDEETRELATGMHAWLTGGNVARDVRVIGDVIVVVVAPDERGAAAALVAREYQALLEETPCEELCFKMRRTAIAEDRAAKLGKAEVVLKKRLAALTAKHTLARHGERFVIDVEKPDIDQREIVRTSAGTRAKLDFRVVDHDAPFMHALVAKVGADAPDGITTDTETWRRDDAEERDVFLVANSRDALGRYLADLAKRDAQLAPPADREIAFQHVGPAWRTVYLKREQRRGPQTFTDANVSVEGERYFVVADVEDPRALAKLTGDHVGHKLAIVLDGKIVTMPILVGRITEGTVSITLGENDGKREATELARILKTGTLPVTLNEERVSELRGGKVVAAQ